jgi:hypothetical protein
MLALALTVFAAAQTARAQSAAAGSYQFTLAGDKYLKYVEFDAQTLADGSASGYFAMTDEAVITIQDVDGTGKETGRLAGYNFKADVDSMVVVNKNQAVLSGIIRSASDASLLGERVLLTVEDNGDNTRIPDHLTWGVYREIKRDWVPSDAELKDDPGVGLRWWATDAERKDDVGYAMPRSETIDANTYPVAAYDFIIVGDAAGDIRVSP